jgi:hypothetical protein
MQPVYGAGACIKAVGLHVVTEHVFGMQEGQLWVLATESTWLISRMTIDNLLKDCV